MVPALYILGGVLVFAWLALGVWALLADRSRGRRRCPRCFFDMSGTDGLRCPECGREAKAERRLFRTRRRWKVAVVGVVLLLAPGLATLGFARAKQAGGWQAVPDALAVRLLWTGEDELVADIDRRVRAGELTRGEAERVALLAARWLRADSRRDQGYVLLDGLARNSYVIGGDSEQAIRPMLEELAPERTTDALFEVLRAGNSSERAQAALLLSHLRDGDRRVAMRLVTMLADPDQAVAAAARSALSSVWRQSDSVRRMPPSPARLVQALRGRVADDGRTLAGLRWTGSRLVEAGSRSSSAEVVRQIAVAELRPEDESVDPLAAQELAHWLWCRETGFSEETFAVTLELSESEDDLTREMAIRLLAGYPWSPEVEAALRRGVFDEAWNVPPAAISAAAGFGPEAAPLIPDLLKYAAGEFRGGSSGFVQDYTAIGGDPETLRRLLVARLVELTPTYALPEDADLIPHGHPVNSPQLILWWLDELDPRDEETARAVRPLLDLKYVTVVAEAAPLYARASGDGTYATRALLACGVRFDEPPYLGSVQYAIIKLCKDGLADAGLVGEYCLNHEDSAVRASLTNLAAAIPRSKRAQFRPWLERLAKDPDPATAAAAEQALTTLPETGE